LFLNKNYSLNSLQYFVFGQLRRVAVISSTLTTKVKGLGYNNQSTDNSNETVFDVADYTIPPG
jgi:hypothetical protein